MTAPERGDIVNLDFEPQAGHEQKKRRPALVLSPASFNETFSLALMAPITTKAKGHAFEVALPKGSGVQGSVMVHQIKSLDWRARRARFVTKAPPRVVAAAAEIIKDIVE